MRKSLTSYLGPVIGGSIFIAALWVLHGELARVHYHEIVDSLSRISTLRLLAAFALTALNYLVLTGYDFLAFRYIQHALAYRRIALASFIGYAFSNSIGLSMLAGGSVRYRLYSAWGLSALEIAKVVAFYTVTLWLGLFTVSGTVFVLEPASLPPWLPLPFSSTRPVGCSLLLVVAGYLLVTQFRRTPLTIRGWEIALPPLGLSILQILVSSLDWTLAGSILYVLLDPSYAPSFPLFLGVYLLAQLSGLLSQIPGGLGALESVVVVGLASVSPAYSVLGSLLAYRMLYYLLPLLVAIVLLGARELLERRAGLTQFLRLFGRWVPTLAPRLFGFMVFVSGGILLLSGATPPVGWRMTLLRDFLPLSVVEVSHFLGSLIGAVLLLVARGLQLRLDGAYFVTVILLGSGIAASLLKGVDFEEATVLGIVLLMLLPCRKYFYRKASLLGEPFTTGWIVCVGIVLVGSLWISSFAFKHVEYTGDMWWTFAFSEGAPRSLRATAGAVVVCVLIASARLLRPALPRLTSAPTPSEWERVRVIVAHCRSTTANLALLGDKRFLLSESGRSFLMYAIEGRSWIAMGDPVGEADEQSELAWRFRETCDRYGGWTVFYEAGKENLPLYLDLGLTLVKVGEEARVSLESYSLEGKSRKAFRNIRNRFDKEGYRFEVVAPEEVPSLLPSMKAISDAWLLEKPTREKRSSLGFFDPEYLRHFPVGLVRRENDLVAFCNLWLGADREELSMDLMRHGPLAPPDSMEYLFIQLMLWGKDQGYRWFNLGMVPLSGLEGHSLAPAWSRLGALLYQHGEHFYNFQGLRQYKEKFDPQWEPRYIACPGGIVLPRIIANVATLISGGMKGVIAK